jgi:hypothetical protein
MRHLVNTPICPPRLSTRRLRCHRYLSWDPAVRGLLEQRREKDAQVSLTKMYHPWVTESSPSHPGSKTTGSCWPQRRPLVKLPSLHLDPDQVRKGEGWPRARARPRSELSWWWSCFWSSSCPYEYFVVLLSLRESDHRCASSCALLIKSIGRPFSIDSIIGR